MGWVWILIMVAQRFFGDCFLAREAVSWSHGCYTFVGVARILGDLYRSES